MAAIPRQRNPHGEAMLQLAMPPLAAQKGLRS